MTEPDIVAELDRWIAYWRNDHEGTEHPFDDLQPTCVLQRVRDEMMALREALDESLKLQSHYAVLLNDYDGGKRLQFSSDREWLDRLRALKDKAP